MRKNNNNYVKIFKYYFENNGVDIPADELDRIIVTLKHLGVYSWYSSTDDCEYYFIKISSVNKTVKKVIDKIPVDFKAEKSSKILFIVNNIQDKLYINNPDFKKEFKIALSKKLSLGKNIKTIKDISAEFIGATKGKYEIEITSRIDSLQYSFDNTPDNESANGYVYIASLFDIVNMYNSVGDSLFDLNVRYKVSDELNVETEICKTLSEKPKEFWFNSNGITIIVNHNNFNCNRPRTIEFSNSNSFSVINGAQTISTAAKWYSANEKEKSNLKDAWVLLRVIIVSDIALSFAKDVSVSLNRQKSISEVDITTTYEFAENINALMNDCENDNICFEISKRGGTPTYKYSYYIDDFAQLVETYLIQKPGSARNSKGALIGTKDNKFVRTDIFKDIKSVDDILKYYSPINYAFELNNSYKKKEKHQLDSTSLIDIIYKYGNMYCIASVIYCINNRKVDDFTSFEYIDSKNNPFIIEKFINCFECFLDESKIDILDSNDFKKDTLYEKFKESKYMNDLYEYIKNIKNNQSK